MLNHSSFISKTPAHRTDEGRSRTPGHAWRGLGALLAALVFIGECGAATPPAGQNIITIADIPLFLVSGAAPNLILTIDDSKSMNEAFLPENIYGNNDPQIGPRDTSPVTNSQYYNPALTYLPAKQMYLDNGTYKIRDMPDATFSAARVDVFGNVAGSDCTLNLAQHYAPTWDLTGSQGLSGGSACTDLMVAANKDNNKTANDMLSIYSTDIIPRTVADFPHDDPYGKNWAFRCMGKYDDCPAFYYQLNQQDKTCADSLAQLNQDKIKTKDFPVNCLTRVVVPPEQQQNFANWFTYYRTRFLTLQTVLSRVFTDLPSRVRFTYQDVATVGEDTSGTLAFKKLAGRFTAYDGKQQKAFFDWFQQSRATSDTTSMVSAAARVYQFCSADQAYLEHPEVDADGALLVSQDPIDNPLYGCRNNFHVMFSDGYWTDTPGSSGSGWDLVIPWLENNDGSGTPPLPSASDSPTVKKYAATYVPSADSARIFADGNTGMLADVVFASWITDLRPNAKEPAHEHLVPTIIRDRSFDAKQKSSEAEQIFWNPANDPADWQHITSFTIGLGVNGNVLYVAPPGVTGDVVYPDGAWTYTDSEGNETKGTLKTGGFPGNWNAIGTDDSGKGAANADKIPSAIRLDDLWHAGINGRGGYFRAGDPDALVTAFQKVLQTVATAAHDSSAAAVAVATGNTTGNDLVYQARMDSTDWSGDIRSYRVSPGPDKALCTDNPPPAGQICENPTDTQPAMRQFQSAAKATTKALVDWTTRHIFTIADDGTAIAFNWDNLSNTQRLDFLKGAGFTGTTSDPTVVGGPTEAQVKAAQARLNYVAGDWEDSSTYGLRTRPNLAAETGCPSDVSYCPNLFGDFINAGPVLVGPPALAFSAATYLTFVNKNKGRPKLIYAGANDGMLHAFDAESPDKDSGLQESFAFIPPVLMDLKKLNLLSDPAYTHQNYVDGPIVTGDAELKRGWSTILAAGLGLGAQALYALDITDPKPPASGVFTGMHPWQFTDRNSGTKKGVTDGDPDLGYVLGTPSIARVRAAFFGESGDPVWVLITGNGYNSAKDDGSRAAGCDDETKDNGDTATLCGQAVLYVIDLETGSLKKRIPTGVGRRNDPLHTKSAEADQRRPNALGQPTVITASVDPKDGDILADYAYAADLFGNVWRFDLTGTGKAVRLLFTTSAPNKKVQPITAPLAFAPQGTDGLVLFGTGKYLGSDDPSDTQVQSFYAIRDQNKDGQDTVTRSTLLEQSFLTEIDKVNTRGRTSTANSDPTKPDGWFIDFDIEKVGKLNKGERVTTEPKIIKECVIFVSLVPETNPCLFGGDGWINMLNLSDGGRPACLFDYTGDGNFDKNDLLALEGGKDDETVPGSSYRATPGGQSTGVYSAPTVTPGPRPTGSTACGNASAMVRVSTSVGGVSQAPISTPSSGSGRVWQQLR